MADSVRSKAGRVLATSDDRDAKSVASFVLGGGGLADTERTKEDLERILAKIEGEEGQHERSNAIRAKLEALANDEGE